MSHLHTCEMEKFIVEYLAVYDCIQLSSKKLDTMIVSQNDSVDTFFISQVKAFCDNLYFAVMNSQTERKEWMNDESVQRDEQRRTFVFKRRIG